MGRLERSVRELAWLAPLVVLYFAATLIATPGADPVRDEPALLEAARHMLDGHLVPPEPTLNPRIYLWHGPGSVALLLPFVALGLPLEAMRLTGPLLLSVGLLLFHHGIRTRIAPRPALAWSYAFGLYVPFLSVITEVHKEPLSIVLVLAGMLALGRGLARPSTPALIAAGLALAALTMVRVEYGWVAIALLALALLGWAVRRDSGTLRRLSLAAAVAVVACLPWLAYTQHVTGKPLYWGSSSGLSLFWMSPTLPGETGQWREPISVPVDPTLAPLRPLFAEAARQDPTTADETLHAAAMDNIRADPTRYARNVLANATRLFFTVPMRPQLSPLRIGANVLFNGALLLGLAWALATWWRRRPPLPPETAAVVAFAVIGVAIHLPASASPRMLLPLVPALLWLIAQVAAGVRSGAAERAPRTSYPVRATASPSESAPNPIPARSSTT